MVPIDDFVSSDGISHSSTVGSHIRDVDHGRTTSISSHSLSVPVVVEELYHPMTSLRNRASRFASTGFVR